MNSYIRACRTLLFKCLLEQLAKPRLEQVLCILITFAAWCHLIKWYTNATTLLSRRWMNLKLVKSTNMLLINIVIGFETFTIMDQEMILYTYDIFNCRFQFNKFTPKCTHLNYRLLFWIPNCRSENNESQNQHKCLTKSQVIYMIRINKEM